MIEKVFKLNDGLEFFLEIPHRVAVIQGDSGTGKSYLFNLLKIRLGNNQHKGDDEFSPLLIVDSEISVKYFIKMEVTDRIIILDRYDIFSQLYPELETKLRDVFNYNHFIICSREDINLPIRNTDYANLIYNAKKKRFRIKYEWSAYELLRED